jgi:hypothetical protein
MGLVRSEADPGSSSGRIPPLQRGDLRSNRRPGTTKRSRSLLRTAASPSTTTQGLPPEAMIVDTI